jgi:hypothetical protein
MLVTAGGVLLPAPESEAALFDCVRRLFCRPVCDTCPAPVVGCPEPVVVEGSYCNPCAPCPTPTCTTSYVQRSYLEPRTCYTTQCALEPCPAYVRRAYWDPCACRYRTILEPSTRYVKRCYSVPTTTYVQRSYLEPVTTCTTPACPTPTCAPACPPAVVPAVPAVTVPAEPVPASPPGFNSSRRSQPLVRGGLRLPQIFTPSRTAAPATAAPANAAPLPTDASARPAAPLAASEQKFASF